MALGKAFIEVHADTKPFAQELGKELGRILKAVENGPARKTGEKLGKELGEGATESFEKSFKPSGKSSTSSSTRTSFFSDLFNVDVNSFGGRMAQGLIDGLDDGLSGLPAEIKIGLAAAAIAAAPFIAGFAGVIAGGLTTSLLTVFGVGLSVAIVSRLTIVQTAWKQTLTALGNIAVQAAQPIVGPILTAFNRIQDRAEFLAPEFERFFSVASRAIVPLTDGVLDLAENALPFLTSSLTNVDKFANVLAKGLGGIGTAVGRAFDIIANDDDALAALDDMLRLIVGLVNFAGKLLKFFIDVNGAIKDVIETLDVFNIVEFNKGLNDGIRETDDFAGALKGLFSSTTSEAEAMEELNKQLDDYISAIDDAWSADIDFEQSLDDLTESLKENGRTLDINSQKGRDNQSALKDAAIALVEQRKQTILLTGDTEAANATFETNRQRLIDAAIAGGLTRAAFDDLTAAILSVPPPVVTGVSATSLENIRLAGVYALNAAGALALLISQARGLSSISIPAPYYGQGPGGTQQYADGGIFNKPTLGVFGEAGEEVLIPTTRPGRAAQLISQSPMLSSMMSPNVNVYIGNQQIDAYIDSRVARSQTATARGLSYGSRSL